MKKVVIFIIIFFILLLAAAGIYLYINTNVKPVSDGAALTIDTTVTELANDEKTAKKQLAEARKNLAKFKPSKPYVVIDTHANKIYFRTEDSVYLEATCSTGSGGEYVDSLTGRHWIFDTPRGVFKIGQKIPHPWWRKPDWAFLEEGEPIPKKEEERYDPNMMGDYAMGFGDGFFIHGTIYERLLGINVTHGCVRVGSDDLEKLYKMTPEGTSLYIF